MDSFDAGFLNFFLEAIMDPRGKEKDEHDEKNKKEMDILIHVFMVGSNTPRFMKWVNNRIKKDENKYQNLYFSSKYRYNDYLRGTTPARYKKIRSIISLSEDISEKELISKLLLFSDGTDKFKHLKTIEDWIPQIMGIDETARERKLTLAYCYRKYILEMDMDSGFNTLDLDNAQDYVINSQIVSMLAGLSAAHRNLTQKCEGRPESKRIVKQVMEGSLEYKLTREMGFFPKEMAKKSLSMFNIPPSDFELLSLSKSELYQIADKIGELKEFELDNIREDDKLITKEQLEDRLSKLERQCLHVGVIAAKLSKLYSEARQIGIEYMDSSDKYKELIDKHQKDFERLRNLEKMQNDKQNLLNELQIKYDRLEKQNWNLMQENNFLNQLYVNEANNDFQDIKSDDDFEQIEKRIDYPDGSILFGGHPNWQRKFSKLCPGVKIMSGVDNMFPDNVLSSRTPLVILNSSYMSHSVFYKVKKLQLKYKFPLHFVVN